MQRKELGGRWRRTSHHAIWLLLLYAGSDHRRSKPWHRLLPHHLAGHRLPRYLHRHHPRSTHSTLLTCHHRHDAVVVVVVVAKFLGRLLFVHAIQVG